MSKPIFLLGIFFLNIVCSEIKGQIKLDNILQNFEKLPELSQATFSFCLLNEEGNVISSINKNKNLIPASSLKVLTTATALQLLGTDYTYNTSLAYSGKIEANILKGNLYIIGSCDPSFCTKAYDITNNSDKILDTWVSSLKGLEINKIEGSIIMDQEIIDDNYPAQSWLLEDIGNYYGTAAYAINYQDNSYEINFKANRTHGNSAEIIPNQELYNVSIHNTVKADSQTKKDNAYIFYGKNENAIVLRGTIPTGDKPFTIKGSMIDPSKKLGADLIQKMQSSGIRISNTTIGSGSVISNVKILSQTKSLPLKELVTITNQNSVNLYAEALLKTISIQQSKIGSTVDGIEQMKKYWLQKGLNFEKSKIVDGSGLSRVNLISSELLSKLMWFMIKETSYKTFISSLAISGYTGTLKSLCQNQACKGAVIAKTGTMDGVVSYVGYIKTSSNRILPFALMINNFVEAPKKMKKLGEIIFNEAVNL